MGCTKSSSKREVYSNTILPEETRKTSNRQPKTLHLKQMGKEVIEEIEERPDGSRKVVKRTVEKGVTFGSVLAMVISFATWKSVGWAIIHGLMGWVYVIYFIIRYR